MEDLRDSDDDSVDDRQRDSPTSSILKTPTHTFLTSRGSTHRTKRLTFANGPVDLESLSSQREGSQESSCTSDSASSSVHTPVSKVGNGGVDQYGCLLVAISPIKTMKVSPDSWTAFQAYKKFEDYANETEKTDYTYSRLSRFRHKEIVPGFVTPPNLSRSPLSHISAEAHSHSSASKYNSTEAYNNYVNNRTVRNRHNYTSVTEDEVDIVNYTVPRPALFKRLWMWMVTLVTVVVSYLSTARTRAWSWISSVVSRRTGESKSLAFEWSPLKLSNHRYVSESGHLSSSLGSWYRRSVTTIVTTSHTSVEYIKEKYTSSSKKQRAAWLLLPLLLLAGFYLALNSSLNNLTNSFNSFTRFLYLLPSLIYTFVLVSIPHFVIHTIPFFFFTLLPHFITFVLPRFFTVTLPSLFWNFVTGIPKIFSFDWLTAALASLLSLLGSGLTAVYSLTSQYLVLFYSYFTTFMFDVVATALQTFGVGYQFVLVYVNGLCGFLSAAVASVTGYVQTSSGVVTDWYTQQNASEAVAPTPQVVNPVLQAE